MLKRLASGVGLVALFVLPWSSTALGQGEQGACGDGGDYGRTGRPEDLPVCVGDGAQRQVLRAARAALIDLSRQIAEEAAVPVEGALAGVSGALSALVAGEGEPEVVALYQRAAAHLSAQAALLPELDGLRSCHARAQVALRQGAAPADATDSGPELAQKVQTAQAALAHSEECMGVARRLLQQRGVQESLSDGGPALTVATAPGSERRLSELIADLRAAHKLALSQRQALQKEWEVVRKRWVRVLFGDRLRVFNEHPDQLPEYDGKARGPLPASVMPRWRYQLPDGRTETYLFRRHSLLRKAVDDPRRS